MKPKNKIIRDLIRRTKKDETILVKVDGRRGTGMSDTSLYLGGIVANVYPADRTFGSMKELMEAMERGEIKPHTTVKVDERIIYLTGDFPRKAKP